MEPVLNLAAASKSVFLRNLEQSLTLLYNPGHGCFYSLVKRFFTQNQAQQLELSGAEQRWQQAVQQKEATEVIQLCRKRYTDLQFEYEKQRMQCWSALMAAAENLLQQSEGQTGPETLNLSARLLGSLFITANSKKNKPLLLEFAYKPFYRAVLLLRLLDHLLAEKFFTEPQWQEWYQQRTPDTPDHCPYRQQLQLPMVMACLLEHFGKLDTQAQNLLTDNGQQSADRVLSSEERAQFLTLCRLGSTTLLAQGLGDLPYRGSKREEREQHQQQHQQLLHKLQLFISTRPDSALGSLFKVSQAYSAIVLPGRGRYKYDTLPKAALMMRDAVQRGEYSGLIVDRLFRLVGIFPQGFGLVYIPLTEDGKPQLRYEFAIVNSFYPEKPDRPLCRIVSRSQELKNTTFNISLSPEYNLYFKPARDRLKSNVPEQKLKELLQLLYKDAEAQYLRHLLPQCWEPDNFFSLGANQNLWNNAHLRLN
jgi:hypothetical protein